MLFFIRRTASVTSKSFSAGNSVIVDFWPKATFPREIVKFCQNVLVTISWQCCIFATNVFSQILGRNAIFFLINGLLGTKSIYFAKQKILSIRYSIIAM